MENISQYYDQSQLSLAAYVQELVRGMSGSVQTTGYINKLKLAGMSEYLGSE